VYNILMTKSYSIGVLRGGPSSEYEVSLKSGASILKNIRDHHKVFDILIDKEGTWHHHGSPKRPEHIFPHIDLFINAMHGEYGEDGTVQKILDTHGISYTGTRSFPSRVAMNKALTKKVLENEGIKTPVYKVLHKSDLSYNALIEFFRTFPHPMVIKPIGSGSSVGVFIVRTFTELENALLNVFAYSPTVMVEEYIPGKEATCGVIDNFREKDIYVLPPIEIRPAPGATFFDYEAKYGGKSEEVCPGNFTAEETKELQEISARAHKALDLRHYSRSDFIIHPRRGIYFLETNTLPGMTTESLFPKALSAVGVSLSDFLEHLIELSMRR